MHLEDHHTSHRHAARAHARMVALTLCLWLQLSLQARGQPATDGAPDAGAATLSTAERIEALQTLASGALPEVPLEQLIPVSLDDDSSMVERDNALRLRRRDNLVASRQARRLNTKTEAELAAMDEEMLLIDLERRVLALPIEVRERLVSAEPQHEAEARASQDRKAKDEEERRALTLREQEAQRKAARARSAQAEARATDHGAQVRFSARAFWVAAAFVLLAFLLIRSRAICEAYLAHYSSGWLASTLQAHPGRGAQLAFAFPALLALAPARLSGRARKGRTSDQALESGENASAGAVATVTSDGGLEELRARLESWQKDRKRGATLVTGGADSSKSAWLDGALGHASGARVARFTLAAGTRDIQSLREQVATACDVAIATASSRESLAEALRQGGPRIICIERLEHGFTRRPGGMEVLRELYALILAVGPATYWLCSIDQLAFRFVEWIDRGSSPFRQLVRLPSEAASAALPEDTALARHFRALRAAPLIGPLRVRAFVLDALATAGSLSHEELAETLRLSALTLLEACEALEELAVLTRAAGRWAICEGAQPYVTRLLAQKHEHAPCEVDMYLGSSQDVALAQRVVAEAAHATRFVTPSMPWTLELKQALTPSGVLMRLRVKVYAFDARYVQALESDVTERVLEGFARHELRLV